MALNPNLGYQIYVEFVDVKIIRRFGAKHCKAEIAPSLAILSKCGIVFSFGETRNISVQSRTIGGKHRK
jgi:hypothetical protein